MTDVSAATDPTAVSAPAARGRRLTALELVVAALIVSALVRSQFTSVLEAPALQTWSTIFVAITVQATPFLVLGVIVSGAIAALLPHGAVDRLLPRNPIAAVAAASSAGLALPGCECGSVPVSRRLIARGVRPAAALAFMIAAPAINPVVLVSTAVAFPGRPEVVAARFVASFATALIVGLLWLRFGEDRFAERLRAEDDTHGSRFATFLESARADTLHAGGYLVIGAALAASIQVVVPRSILDTLAGSMVLAVITLALLAVLLSICSEADAFVAAGLAAFPLSARLVFLVVGPVVDLKLIALQVGSFGRDLTLRFAPLSFVVAVACGLAAGWWLT